MVDKQNDHLTREDWLRAALEISAAGIDRVKIVPLAESLGVTTGSFYWHFKNRHELFEALLEYWEHEMTDTVIEAARQHPGPPGKLILDTMKAVMSKGLARYDLPFWQLAQTDTSASRVFKRVLHKRFAFTAWMFCKAGFSRHQAEIRARMMVIYMMGESTLIPESMAKRMGYIQLKHAILTAPEQ